MANTEEEKNPIKERDTIFDSAIQQSDAYTNQYIDAIGNFGAAQDKVFEDQGEYLVSQLEQNKKKAEQSYRQEQSAAYTDYQKQVDPYGVQAEQMASSGLSNSGYAESLKTQAYVAYQNRSAMAMQSYNDAVVSFENTFTEAKMQNDSARASLAFQVLQMQLEAAITGFQYKNQLLMDEANTRLALKTQYPEQWQDIYNQIYASDTAPQQEQTENEEQQAPNGDYVAVKTPLSVTYDDVKNYVGGVFDNAKKGVDNFVLDKLFSVGEVEGNGEGEYVAVPKWVKLYEMFNALKNTK